MIDPTQWYRNQNQADATSQALAEAKEENARLRGIIEDTIAVFRRKGLSLRQMAIAAEREGDEEDARRLHGKASTYDYEAWVLQFELKGERTHADSP